MNPLDLVANAYRRLARSFQSLEAFDGQRDYDRVLGYPQGELDYDDLYIWYRRSGIARRIVRLPATDTWKRPPPITEDGEVTPFTAAWDAIVDRLGVWGQLSRADIMSGIGRYGGLIIGTTLGDGESTETPIEEGSLIADDIIYLRPFSEGACHDITFNNDTQSARYGLPEFYEIDVSADDQTATQKFHWTRVIHIAEERDDSEVYGTPRLEAAFNYVLDLMKYVGGGAEATWLNMRPGTLIKPAMASDGSTYQITTDTDDLEQAVQDYTDDPMRVLLMRYAGVDVENIPGANVPDTSPQADAVLDLIAASTGIPKRVLMGSAAGQLASAQEDTRQWASHVATRQKTYVEPDILRPFIDRLVFAGALPEPGAEGYTVGVYNERDDAWQWPSIIEMTDSDEADITLKYAQARQTLARAIDRVYVTSAEEDRLLLGLPAEEDMAANIAVNQAMPLPERQADEAALQSAVATAFSDWEATLGDEPPDYQALREALTAAILPIIWEVARMHAENIQREYQLFVDGVDLDVAVTDWAERYTGDLTDGLIATTRELMGRAATAQSPEEAAKLIARALGPERAELISITEVTTALSAGLAILGALYNNAFGIQLDERWFTQQDERTCRVCGPLHNKTRQVWEREFPDGPPAHPRCRCYKQVVGVRRAN